MKLQAIIVLAFMLPCIKTAGQVNLCPSPQGYRVLDANQVAAGILTGGDLWWNLETARYRVPKSGLAHSMYAGALWIGGLDTNGTLRLAANTYRTRGFDYWAGPLDSVGTTHAGQCYNWDRLFSIDRATIDQHKALAIQYGTAGGGLIPYHEIHVTIRNWPAQRNPFFLLRDGTPFLITRDMAPFVDTDNDGEYNPHKGDYPLLFGDQMFWWIFNDNGGPHTASGGMPVGIDVKAMAYSYNTPGHLDFTTFYRFEITGHLVDLSDVRVGIWADPDIGWPFDDFVGCDTLRDMGIGFNGPPEDTMANGYGTDPPFMAVRLLQAEDVQGVRKNRIMTAFHLGLDDFTGTGMPIVDSQFYHHLNGRWSDGAPVVYNGMIQKFIYHDEPSDWSGYSQCALGHMMSDQRMLLSSGPFQLPKHGTITLDFAAIWARCSSFVSCPLFKCIQDASDSVKAFFHNTVLHTSAPPKPELLGFHVFPNPAEGRATVRFEGLGVAAVHIELVDLAGRVVYSASAAPPLHTIPTAHLPRGLYLVRAFNGKRAGHSKLVLK